MRESVSRDEGGGIRAHWFESSVEFADAAARCERRIDDKNWTGETWEEALEGARRGRTALVAEAERLLEQVQVSVETPRSEWVRSRAGAFPVVPEALAGYPEPMRRKVWVPSDRAPLRVVVDLVSSAGISHGHLARRGVAALARSIALSQERALELFVAVPLVSGGRRVVTAVRIPTTPLDLASACCALTSGGFVRALGYSYGAAVTGGGSPRAVNWAFGYYPATDAQRARYVGQLRAALELSEGDLVLPPTFLTDPAAEDPVGFVRRSLAEHGQGSGE